MDVSIIKVNYSRYACMDWQCPHQDPSAAMINMAHKFKQLKFLITLLLLFLYYAYDSPNP